MPRRFPSVRPPLRRVGTVPPRPWPWWAVPTLHCFTRDFFSWCGDRQSGRSDFSRTRFINAGILVRLKSDLRWEVPVAAPPRHGEGRTGHQPRARESERLEVGNEIGDIPGRPVGVPGMVIALGRSTFKCPGTTVSGGEGSRSPHRAGTVGWTSGPDLVAQPDIRFARGWCRRAGRGTWCIAAS